MTSDYDIIIVGAGPAGLSFALSLAGTGLQIAVVEKQPEQSLADPAFDGRDIALTHQSVGILRDLGVWSQLSTHTIAPIVNARVLDGDSPYSLDIDIDSEKLEALGYLVSNHCIRKVLYDELQNKDSIEMCAGTAVVSVTTDSDCASVVLDDHRSLAAPLVVAADSRFSDTRRMLGIPASMLDFGRVCIVCRMEHDQAHDGIAYECFQYGGTLAVLPLSGNQSSIVVTAPMSQKDEIMGMTPSEFNDTIQRRFDGRHGDMRLVTERFAYPLVAVHARRFFATRFALIGDAAVGMHPVTAHGFNLGLSGQAILAKQVVNAAVLGKDPGDTRLLKHYSDMHMRTTRPIYHGTNEIVRMFTDDRPHARALRKLTLHLANNFPPIKHVIHQKLTESDTSTGLLSELLKSRGQVR